MLRSYAILPAGKRISVCEAGTAQMALLDHLRMAGAASRTSFISGRIPSPGEVPPIAPAFFVATRPKPPPVPIAARTSLAARPIRGELR